MAKLILKTDGKAHKLGADAQTIAWNGRTLQRGHSKAITIRCTRWMAISRVNIYWVEPQFGESDLSTVPSECQLLLWQDDDKRYHVAVPLCNGDFRATIRGKDNANIQIDWHNGTNNTQSDAVELLFIQSGKRPHQLIQSAMKAISQRYDHFQHRTEKACPDFVHYLGWCTWDAFYHSVDQRKIKAGLNSFRKGGVQLGHMILDDGMLQHRNEMLSSFAADPKKFPKGLAQLAQMAKEDYGLHSFGVWHAFQGYWRGLDPSSELGKDYKTFKNRGYIRPWEGNDQLVDLSCIEPTDIYRFYFDFYRYLSNQGVDMTKVDNQSALERYTHNKRGRVSSMRAYQEAYQAAAQHFFGGNTLHCMSSSSDVGMNMRSTNAYRNSDDYFPKKGPAAQQHHVFVNAYNATLSSHFSIPDWDMFQTHAPCPEFHAAARALSGGPIYVCDYPGKQNFKILKKLGLSDGRSLRCKNPALVCEDSLFTNVETEAKALKIYNNNSEILILGLFHCYHGQQDIECSYRVKDHPDAANTAYACYEHQSQQLRVHAKNERQSCSLGYADYEIVTCSPIVDGIAAFGLLDKYNSSAAIDAHGWDQDQYFCSLAEGSGRIGFYCQKKPKSIFVNGKKKPFMFNNGLLTLRVNSKKPVDILITPA